AAGGGAAGRGGQPRCPPPRRARSRRRGVRPPPRRRRHPLSAARRPVPCSPMAASSNLPAPTESIRRRSSGNQAADYIRTLIFEGQLRPGQRVPQEDVAEALSLSRIPVREGLIALEREGWVSIELNRGAFVNTLD